MKEAIIKLVERYLIGLARVILTLYKPVIIGITGSVGKTSTREAIYQVLRSCGLPVKQTEGNLNTDLGIALTVLGYDHSPAIWEWPVVFIMVHINWLLLLLHLTPLPRYLVVEMGVDRLGDMERMLRVIKPTIGIVTWIGEGHHLEFLKDPETIAKEKGKILSSLPQDGLAVLPARDPQLSVLESMVIAPVVKIEEAGMAASLKTAEVVAKHLGMEETRIAEALKKVKRPKGRLNTLKGIHDSLIIDDTYNSSLPSVKLALDVLAETEAKRRITVLGDVLEQGEQEEQVHKIIATLAKQKAQVFIGVGKRFQKTEPDQWYASPNEAATALQSFVQEGDVILVKGSQGMRMEKVSLALIADKKEAAEYLPRQSKRWQQIPFANP